MPATIASTAEASYELLDFGDGRKLERFGQVILDRPSPAAEGARMSHPERWQHATARFTGARTGEGTWRPAPKNWAPADWRFVHRGASTFELALEPLPSGQVGVFPEQRASWNWIAQQLARAFATTPNHAPRVLNLFAYTGASTLAASAAGAEVVHVDAARNVVDRARRNAALSGLADGPIRWIAEDTQKFCRREVKRGNQYDAIILDPPTYGHGPKGEPWKIAEHLLPLLKMCGQLTAERRAFVLVTCHTPGIGPAELAAYLAEGLFGRCAQPPTAGELYLETRDARRLPAGAYARWPGTIM